jgi:hypothetical protein
MPRRHCASQLCHKARTSHEGATFRPVVGGHGGYHAGGVVPWGRSGG